MRQVTAAELQHSLDVFLTKLLPHVNTALHAALDELSAEGIDVFETRFVPISLQAIIGGWFVQNLKTPEEREQLFDHLILSFANQIGVELADENGDPIEVPKAEIVIPS